jgi:glucose dehydrogenase
MRKILLASCFGVAALFTAGYAVANDELTKLSADPNQWVMPTQNYANTRYSELKQVNTENVHKIAPVWTFSTGVLRGHEGSPLVIGDVMYVHAPFPNTVFALDLNNDGKILWKYEPRQDPSVIGVMCCDTVNRGVAYADGKIFLHQADTTLVALDAKTGAVGEGRRSVQGSDRHRCADGRQGQGFRWRLRRRVRRSGLGQRLQYQGRQAGVARLFHGSRFRYADRSGKDDRPG